VAVANPPVRAHSGERHIAGGRDSGVDDAGRTLGAVGGKQQVQR
jgi:hypothetical protein